MAEFTETGAARPRRSCLYMPGTNARAHEKAKTLAADVLIFDLEDSVAPDAKEAARAQVSAAIAAGGFGRREIVVRVNTMGTPWAEADLRAAAAQPMFSDCGRYVLVYNGESHGLRQRKNRKDLSVRLSQFFDHYLKGAAMPVWMADGIPAVMKGKTYGFELKDKGGN